MSQAGREPARLETAVPVDRANRRAGIEFDPRLVEEAVFTAVERSEPAVRRSFHAEREAPYAVLVPEDREEAFRQVHSRWFLALSLGGEVEALVAEHPSLAQSTSRLLVLRAASPGAEGADLHAPPDPAVRSERRPILLIQLLPRTLLDRSRLQPLLRRELIHVTDMLDPLFGYEPRLTTPDGGPGHENLVRERYRILWETTVEGRLDRAGHLPAGAAERRCALFAGAFAMLGPDLDHHFRRFFSGPRPSHAEMAAFAASPPSVRNEGAHAGGEGDL